MKLSYPIAIVLLIIASRCIFMLFFCILGEISAQQAPSIQTNPALPSTTIATGYVGLQLSVQLQRGMYHGCTWRYGNTIFVDIFTSAIPCNSIDGSGYELNCANSNNSITSTLTILLATNKSLNVRVECQKDPLVSQKTVTSLDLNVAGEKLS